MQTDLVQKKIADNKLRRFVKQHAGGQESVLIQVDVPAPMVTFDKPRQSHWQRSVPCHVTQVDEFDEKENDAIEHLKCWFQEIGLKARYLGSARAFSAKVTSDQLMQIVNSKKVLAVALNRKGKAFT